MSAGVHQVLPLDRPLEHAVAAAAEGAVIHQHKIRVIL